MNANVRHFFDKRNESSYKNINKLSTIRPSRHLRAGYGAEADATRRKSPHPTCSARTLRPPAPTARQHRKTKWGDAVTGISPVAIRRHPEGPDRSFTFPSSGSARSPAFLTGTRIHPDCRQTGIPALRISRPSLELTCGGASLRYRRKPPPRGGGGSQTIHKTNKINPLKQTDRPIGQFHIAKVLFPDRTRNRQIE